MGDAQSAQRDGTNEAKEEEQIAVQDGPSGESTHDKLIQNNGQISDLNGKTDGTIAEVKDHCEDKITKAITLNDKVTSVSKSEPEEVTKVKIIQEQDVNEEDPIEIINVDAKQNDLNESFRKFFSNIGLKMTVKRGVADKADDEGEKEVEKLDVEKNESETKYEDVEQNTDLNAIQDNDSTTCPTLTDGTPEDVVETVADTKEWADNLEVQEANDPDDSQNKDAMHDESQHNQEEEELVSPIKKFFTTGIFAGLAKKKKEEELEDKELVNISKNDATQEQEEIVEASPTVTQQNEIQYKDTLTEVQAMEVPEENIRGKSPSTDQDSEPEITSSQEKAQSSPFKRLFSGTSFKKRSKRLKRRKSSDAKLSDSGDNIENKVVVTSEKTEELDKPEEIPSPSPPTTEPEEELSAWEAFKKLMTPKKSFKRVSEETQVPTVTVEETKPSEGERISDNSMEEGRKRKDSSHSWEAVLCGSGRRRSRKTSDSEDEQKEDSERVESPNEAEDVVTSTPKQAASPSDSESSTWKSLKKLMTPKRKVKEDEESKDNIPSDNEMTQEETMFSLRKLLPSRKKKQDQLSSDEGEKEAVSIDEDSETPAVVPLSEFDQSETEEIAKTDTEIEECKLEESEQEHILEIPKTFVQEIQEHQVTQITAVNQEQDELTEFSKYQPLSDIPEEGNITETVATSLIEEVVKDDTIAEDMVEITSEAITAPEPVDITMADETDELMLSAASHLPESSKTSGNATPVPAEYDVKDSDILLKEVVEMISTETKMDTNYSDEPALVRVIGSVTHGILERSVTKDQDEMGVHQQSEVMTIETEQTVDQLQDAEVEIPATGLSESLSEFKDAISTEFVSEISKVEFESAKVDVDEVQTAHPGLSVKQESVDDSEYMIESLSEVPESTGPVFLDTNQEILPAECQEEAAMVTESIQPLSDGKVKAIENVEEEKTEIQHFPIKSEPKLPKAEVDPVPEMSKEDKVIHKDEAVEESNAQIDQPDQLIQSKSEEIEDVQSVEGAAKLGKDVTQELSNEQSLKPLQEESEKSVEVEAVVEEEFEIVSKQDVEDAQETTLESQLLPEDIVKETVVQKEECVTDLDVKEKITVNIHTEQAEHDIVGDNEPEHDITGLNDQNKDEEHISEISETAHEEEVPVIQATTEQEDTKLPDSGAQEVTFSGIEDTTNTMVAFSRIEDATNTLIEETVEEEVILGTVLLAHDEIIEQKEEEIVRQVVPQDGNGEVDEQPLESTAGEIGDTEEEETKEGQETEMLPEVTGIPNGLVSESSATERKVVFKLDHALEINGEHIEAEPSTAQVMQEDHCHEITENVESLPAMHVSTIIEDSGTAQEFEDTAFLEKSSELFLSTSEEPIPELHIGETEVNVERQLEEEIPSAVTELANVEHVALPEESLATSQQVTPTIPDLVILKTVENSEKISEKTSIPCTDNAESLDEPSYEIQLSEVQLVGIQGEKEEEIVPPVPSNADVQHALVTQTTSCSFKDVASEIPDVSIEKTTEIHEPMLGVVASEQEYNESIETTTTLEEGHVIQAAQEGKTAVLMHVPSIKFEDNHQIQVEVVDVDIQTAEARVDTALEISVQEDKELVDICHQQVDKVDSDSATSEIEQEMVNEEDKPAILEVVQHVKELATERKEPSSDSVDGKLNKDQKTTESQDEEDAVAAVTDSVMATKDEVLSKIDEVKEVQKTPTVETQVNTPNNSAVAVPQNTGIISSYGNVEAPSSLSLEFKLNIQFGQSKTPILPSTPITTERTISSQSPIVHAERSDPPKSTEITEVRIQAVDVESNQENVKQKSEIVMADSAVQATEATGELDFTEPVEQCYCSTTNKGVAIQLTEKEEPIDEVKMTEITENKTIWIDVGTQSIEIDVEEKTTMMEISDDQPIQIDVGIQAIQQEELSEKDKIPEVECPSIQTAETVQPDKEFRKKEVVFTELVVSETPIKQTEDEDENQDVWMDAEEDIDGKEEKTTLPLCEIEESIESQPDYFQETKSDFEDSIENIKKTTQKCDTEEEDFAAALEDPQIATAITTMEWD